VLPIKDNIPTARFPFVTVLLIVINIAVFAWELTLPTDRASNRTFAAAGVAEQDQAILEYGAIPYRLTHPGDECGVTQGAGGGQVVCQGSREFTAARQGGRIALLDTIPWWLTILTSMFLHGGWLHIGGNMLFLWIFGNNVEDSVGRWRYVLFYLLGGLIAAYSQAAIHPSETGPQIGASGAIAGVLGGYILLYPGARVLTLVFLFFFVTIIEVPALIMLGVWFVLQALPAVGQLATPDVASGGGVAYLAHIGGFIFGLLAIRPFVKWAGTPRPRVALR
jgi:membrane associated rhomboid family serine protease